MKTKTFRTLLSISAGVLTSLGTGCHSLNVTEPPRSVTEQLLLSTAADRAVKDVDLTPIVGKRVYIEEEYFESYDAGYAKGAIREMISSGGAFIMENREDAESIVEIRSGGLGIDKRDLLFGIPGLVLPIPFAGNIETPEIALYKSVKADSVGKFALFAYDRESGEFQHSTGGLPGYAKFHHYKFLGFISWRSTDIPELDPKIRKRLKQE